MLLSREEVQELYLQWLCEFIRDPDGLSYDSYVSWEILLKTLHDTQFTYIINRDQNRAEDGLSMRSRFIRQNYDPEEGDVYYLYLKDECSILEMMVALSLRCEETIMEVPQLGNRTSYWFWQMIISLGLGGMYDDIFDTDRVQSRLSKFLKRDYNPDGSGGLFTIRNINKDLRKVEIWYQMCWYLDRLV